MKRWLGWAAFSPIDRNATPLLLAGKPGATGRTPARAVGSSQCLWLDCARVSLCYRSVASTRYRRGTIDGDRMKTFIRTVAKLIAATVLLGCATELRSAGEQTPLILISIDGFRSDYLDRGASPALSALARDGVRAEAMHPSFPSLTFPNHYTLVTGLRSHRHGVVNNQMEDPEHPNVVFTLRDRDVNTQSFWWDDAVPLWVSAEQQGVRSATMFWPGSEAAIRGVRPSQWVPFDQSISSGARVDRVLTWLDLPLAERPSFITLYFDVVDSAGHRFGPDSVEVNRAIAEVDDAIARLVEGLTARGLENRTNLVIVSDHGMAAVADDRVVDLDAIVDPARVRYVWPPGQIGGVAPRDGENDAVAEAALGRHEHFECWRGDEMPAHLHFGAHPRTPAIVCMADVGWTMLSTAHPRTYPVRGGAHGFDPTDPTMNALFVAHGPAFRSGATIEAFDNVDVYSLLATLANIAPEPSDGAIDTFLPVLNAHPQ